MMTSLRKTPLSRQAMSSLVTVMRPLLGGGGYWINLKEGPQKKVSRAAAHSPAPYWTVWTSCVRADLAEDCCRLETLTTGFLHICWFLSGVLAS